MRKRARSEAFGGNKRGGNGENQDFQGLFASAAAPSGLRVCELGDSSFRKIPFQGLGVSLGLF